MLARMVCTMAVLLMGQRLVQAAEPAVAVVWAGPVDSIERGRQVAEAMLPLLFSAKTVKPIASAEQRKQLIDGGVATEIERLERVVQTRMAEARFTEALPFLESLEKTLLTRAPVALIQKKLGAVERGLIACYKQAERTEDVRRSTERLKFTPGDHSDVAAAPAVKRPTGTIQVESAPPGAKVYRNLELVGVTPCAVALGMQTVDILHFEWDGGERAFAALPDQGEKITLAADSSEKLPNLVDTVRAKMPDAPVQTVAEIGRLTGAGRVLVVYPDGKSALLVRVFDTAKVDWTAPPLRVDGPDKDEAIAAVAYAEGKAVPVAGAVAGKAAKPKGRWGAWGKWYTWVAAGAVVAAVAGILIAQNVGSDSVHVTIR